MTYFEPMNRFDTQIASTSPSKIWGVKKIIKAQILKVALKHSLETNTNKNLEQENYHSSNQVHAVNTAATLYLTHEYWIQ